jgi:hypothetical protein
MEINIFIWIVIALPLVLGVIFRVGAPHLFFSVMAGELLARYFGHDVEKIANESISAQSPEKYGELLLLIIPILLTAFFMRKTVSKSRTILNIIPLAITGVVLAAFVFPLLSQGIQDQINVTFVGGWILNLNRAIIGVVVVLQILYLWLFSRSEKSKKSE